MKEFIVILDTKYIGKHRTSIKARNLQEAKEKAVKKFENENNEVKGIFERKEGK